MTRAMRGFLKSQPILLAPIMALYGLRYRRDGCIVKLGHRGEYIAIRKEDAEIRLNLSHNFYVGEVARYFERFLTSVEVELIDGVRVADFSRPRYHRVPGLTFPFLFTSLPEESAANVAYLETFCLSPGDVVIDAGAYCGLTSYLFSRAVGSGGLVISIEADPENYLALVQNVERSGVTNIRTVHAAVWDSRGTLPFQAYGIIGSSVSTSGKNHSRLVDVPSATLMDICRDLGVERVDHVKMDIEGAEYRAIPASDDFVRKFRPDFIVEAHRDGDGPPSVDKLLRSFAAHGYSMRRVAQPGPELFPLLHFVNGGR